MKLDNILINPAFDDLFSFKSMEDKIEHDAQMISYRILSALEKICDQRNISKKALADMLGTSKSYITQLFNGSKSINTNMMARLEIVLDARFEISLKLLNDAYSNSMNSQLYTMELTNLKPQMGWSKYKRQPENVDEIVGNLSTENVEKQAA